ncbi:MAG: alpha-amylase family glycosyl hydrolase [Clostridia bacterium]|nr:alpha-amylase family glycosyl hydrolase [Clostridia bacterium]
MQTDIFSIRKKSFVLWRPANTDIPPKLILGEFRAGNPCTFKVLSETELSPHPEYQDLWLLPVDKLNMEDEKIYLYFFEITNSNVYSNTGKRVWCTDPMAWAVDWRPVIDPKYNDGDQCAASIVKLSNGELTPCDINGETIEWHNDGSLIKDLPGNQNIVMVEIPTSWARIGSENNVEIDVGSYQDILALIDPSELPANFVGTPALGAGRAYLTELGINAVELLPPSDSHVKRQWGYATTNYFASDTDLGLESSPSFTDPVPMTLLGKLIHTCHLKGIRLFADMVMGFSNRCALRNINFLDFYIEESFPGHSVPVDPEKDGRENWGGDLFKYNYKSSGYSPLSGGKKDLYPAREFMKVYALHWINHYHIDGIRIDSIPTIMNYEFIQDFKDTARKAWHDRLQGLNLMQDQTDARFLVLGEELSDPIPLIEQNRLDSCWNEKFLYRVRSAIIGENEPGDLSFEDTIRKLIDCRNVGFRDGSQAINYLTSHDTGGYRKERLYNFLEYNNVSFKQERIELAFVCLLTAVGIPMWLIGEEFGDKHDRATIHPDKQQDPVNFDRLKDPWRRNLSKYVSRLVKFRAKSGALAVNETEFIHTDFTPGRRIIAWRRGLKNSTEQVVVVANFSPWGQPSGSEYVVHNWPSTPSGKQWKEITQDRFVPEEWVGRESIIPWEAKVYSLV